MYCFAHHHRRRRRHSRGCIRYCTRTDFNVLTVSRLRSRRILARPAECTFAPVAVGRACPSHVVVLHGWVRYSGTYTGWSAMAIDLFYSIYCGV